MKQLVSGQCRNATKRQLHSVHLNVVQQNVVVHDTIRIIKTLCRKLKLPEDFDYQQLARLTPGYVGADLMALCREAAMTAVNRALLQVTGEPHNQSSATDQAASDGTDGEVQKKLIVDPAPEFHGELGQSPPQV